LALVERAVSECPTVVVSIYVNPAQFGPGEDFEAYPRQEAEDLALLEPTGAAVAFLPGDPEMRPAGGTGVKAGSAATGWEGDHRPGHFDGVATVVTKLFVLSGCDAAYFGLKDLQQCAVVRQLVRDLGFSIDLKFVETVRSATGLALSSRNRYLDQGQQERAAGLYRELTRAASAILTGTSVLDACRGAQDSLQKLGFELDYLALVDPDSMFRIEEPRPGARLVAAARLSGVRLIDNVGLDFVSSA
jgi:pantoate--beta-alanine ligase